MAQAWHTLGVAEVFKEQGSGQHGLSSEEAKQRLATYGPNRLPAGKVDGPIIIFLRQFQSPLIYLLLLAAFTVYLMGEHGDAYIILAVLLLNSVIGAVQEGRAQNTLRALRNFSETNATVIRDGKELIIPDCEVVPGDLLVLQEGIKVSADARVVLSRNLTVDEASLTGESEPVRKTTEALLSVKDSPAEQSNMVFKGSFVPSGNGQAIVVATGSSTMLGAIAAKIAAIDTDVPLKANIRDLSRLVIIIVAVMSVVLFVLGVAMGNPPRTMFATVISLAVSVIPEGLPIVMTLVLATGVWRMSKRNVLVKKLQAVEALGAARIIAVDKTGTITKNELTAQTIWTAGRTFTLGGAGYEPKGDITFEGSVVDAANHPELLYAGKIASLSATAQVMYSEEDALWKIGGDPTEAALLVAGQKVGFSKEDLERETPLLFELSFDYVRKYHATIHQTTEGNLLSVVGAPEAILGLCSSERTLQGDMPLTPEAKAAAHEMFETLSVDGLRVIAFATASINTDAVTVDTLPPLTFGGYFAMKDALRTEAAPAVARAQEAGIRVVMITGDHVKTAVSIAREVGIAKEGDGYLTGAEIDALSDADLAAKLGTVSVFARVTPEHKLRIITAYRLRGDVVAMTGDGVNDAPPLVAADLGVAMGLIGTEVAKEAADIILMDDNFGSIVSAVEEGRSIYKTIKKVVLYLFSTGAGEAITIIGALLIGLPLPVLAAQIIWLNFVTDGFLTVALGVEPKEKGLLTEKFERPKKYLIDRVMFIRMITMAVPMAVGTLYVFSLYQAPDLTLAWTMSLTTLAVFQWFNAWNCRSDCESVFSMNPFRNPYLILATAVVILLQILAVYVPFLQDLLHTTALTLDQWLLCILVSLSIVVIEEIRKVFHRRALRSR